MCNRRHNPTGFTLVELLVAGMILAVSATALGVAVRQGYRSLALARDYQTAAGLLDETFTKIDTIGPAVLDAFGPTSGAFDEPNERFRWSAEFEPRLEGSLWDVTVTIAWTSATGPHEIEAQTRLNDPSDPDDATLFWEDL